MSAPADPATPPAMARPTLRSLRVRLALGLGLLVVGVTATLTFAIGELATTLARKEIGRYLTRLSIEMRDKLDTGMAERMAEVGMLAGLDAGIHGPRNPAVRRALLAELKRAHGDYAWLGYVDAMGRVEVGLAGRLEGEDVSARPWFRHALAGPHAGEVRDAIVEVAFPLAGAGTVHGVVAAHVDWGWAARLRDAIEGYAQAESPFELLVLAADGTVLLGPRGLAGTRLAREELSPAHLRTYEARLERWADGVAYLTGTSATRGFGQYRGLGWVVVVRQRAELAFAPVRQLQLRIALAGGLVALLAIFGGWLIAGRVGRPLAEISRAADRISRGRRRVQIPSGGAYAEVAQLAESLRSMLASLNRQEEDLRNAQDHLEARVAERTADLARAHADVAAAKDRLALAMEASRLVLWDYDVPTGRVTLSEAWSELLGGAYVATTETIASLTGLVPEEERPALREAIGAAVQGRADAYRVEHRVRTAAGSPLWIVSEGRVVARDAAGRALRLVGTNRDITDRVRDAQALRASEGRFRGAFEHSAIGMAIVGLDGRWEMVNPALCAITGYTSQELLARTFDAITHPEDRSIAPAQLRELLAGRCDAYQIEKRYLHKRGHVVWVQVNVSLVRDLEGRPQHLISQVIDVSERHRLQEKIEHLALHDPLTGLPNSRLLMDRLEQALASARRTRRSMGVMYMDLDGFKPVNDTYGHAAGDLVLKEFAARLGRVLRETDTVARVGGDEFVAVLSEVAGEAEAQRAAERILAAVSTRFPLGDGREATLSASVGLALFPDHGEDAQSLLQRADTAMYQAKRGGKNAYRFYAGETA